MDPDDLESRLAATTKTAEIGQTVALVGAVLLCVFMAALVAFISYYGIQLGDHEKRLRKLEGVAGAAARK